MRGLAKVRLELGLSVSEFARKNGISPSTVRRIEANQKCSLKTVAKIIDSWPARQQYIMFSYLFKTSWKYMFKTPEEIQDNNEYLESLRMRAEEEENNLRMAA